MSTKKRTFDPKSAILWVIISGMVENFLKKYNKDFKETLAYVFFKLYPTPIVEYVSFNFWKELLDILAFLESADEEKSSTINYEILENLGLHDFYESIFKDGKVPLSKELTEKDFLSMLVANMVIAFFASEDIVSYTWGVNEVQMKIYFSSSSCPANVDAYQKKLIRKYNGGRNRIFRLINLMFCNNSKDTLYRKWPNIQTWQQICRISCYLSCDDISHGFFLPLIRWLRYQEIIYNITNLGIEETHDIIMKKGLRDSIEEFLESLKS